MTSLACHAVLWACGQMAAWGHPSRDLRVCSSCSVPDKHAGGRASSLLASCFCSVLVPDLSVPLSVPWSVLPAWSRLDPRTVRVSNVFVLAHRSVVTFCEQELSPPSRCLDFPCSRWTRSWSQPGSAGSHCPCRVPPWALADFGAGRAEARCGERTHACAQSLSLRLTASWL